MTTNNSTNNYSASPLTTKGDIYGYDTAGNRIPVGADNQVIVADSTQTLGVKYQYPTVPWTNETEAYTWDFLSNAGNVNDRSWSQTTSGTGSSVTSPTSYPTTGVVDGQCAILCAAVNSYAAINMGQSSGNNFFRYLSGGQIVLESRVSFVTASTSSERFIYQFGLLSANNSNAPNGVFFTYSDNINSGQWTGNCVTGGTPSTTTSGSAVATATQYRLTAIVNAAATSISFYVNGTLLGSAVTSNIPTAVGLMLVSRISKTVSSISTSEEADIDYMAYQKQFSTPR